MREGRCHRIHQDVVVVHNILPCFALQSAVVVVVVLATSFAELLIPVSVGRRYWVPRPVKLRALQNRGLLLKMVLCFG